MTRLARAACGIAALIAVPLPAQITTSWQATTTTMWSSDGGCSTLPIASARAFASSETLAGTIAFASRGRASVDFVGALAAGERACAGDRWSGLGALRASFTGARTRVWIAYAAANAGSRDTSIRYPGFSAGVQRRVGRALLSMSVGPRRDRDATQRVVQLTQHLYPDVIWPPGGTAVQETLYVADTSTQPVSRRIADVGFAVAWTHRALGIDAAAHLAIANRWHRSDPLARVEVRYHLSPRVSAIAGVVTRASVPFLDIPARQIATLGLRIHGGRSAPATPGARARATEFRAERNAGDVSLAVRAPGAGRVEIAGDFTHWSSLALERGADGWWRAQVRAAPGLHQLSVRVDGGRWGAPPGLPPVRDEFGATVGLLVVP